VQFFALATFIVDDECDTHDDVVVVVVRTWDLRIRQRLFREISRVRTG